MYLPPGDLKDFDDRQRELWHKYVQGAFSGAIDEVQKALMAAGTAPPDIPQFYDAFSDAALAVGQTMELDIVWNAFPGELLRRFGRDKAMRVADTLWPLPAFQLGWKYVPGAELPENHKLIQLLRPIPANKVYPRDCWSRPQTEYCEWQVQRESEKIRSVTFTCEPPEYWQAIAGVPLDASAIVFPDRLNDVLGLYRELVSPLVDSQALLATGTPKKSPLGLLRKGKYDPYNRWNTCCGIAHLSAPPNALRPEIMLAALASQPYKSVRGKLVVLPDVLVAGAGFGDMPLGNANRNSDVAIAAAVNALARQGRRLTLANPVGIFMDGIDLSGWQFPPGLSATDCIHVVRGDKRLRRIMRLVVKVPGGKYSVSDIRIGGVPIRHGGQIAECITLNLRAVATVARGTANQPLPLTFPALVCPRGGSELFASFKLRVEPPPTTVSAFSHEASPRAPEVPTFTPESREALDEPELELEQIQGLAVPGFLKPSQTLICVHHRDNPAALHKVRALLRQLQERISTGLATLDDRNAYRRDKQTGKVLLGIGFTFCGLHCLTASAKRIRSRAFRQGLAARSALLGDPTTRGEPGHPSGWKVGGPRNIPRFMLVVAGQDRQLVNREVEGLVQLLDDAGCKWQRQDGDKLDTSSTSREHFGFVDGISQPGIRGRVPHEPWDFVTPKRIADWPASGLYGYPGQDLVWPGEFVLGYPRTGPDPLMPGPEATPDVHWMKNGSYLVYNRLLQDVGLFWKTMAEEAARLAQYPGFEDMTAEGLASRMVGRTRNGVPVSRLQGWDQAFHEGMGAKPHANNNFRFDADTPRLQLLNGTDAYPQAKADPLGMVCPLTAHIRKVNPRDSASDVGGESSNHQHRILRTGVSFGEKRKDLKSPPKLGEREPERGQLFLCVQASIEAQFEFLQSRWMNHEMRPKSPGGHDMLAGRKPSEGGGIRHCTIFGAQGQRQEVFAGKPFVTSSGGGYFFVPSLAAIRDVLSAEP